MQEIYSSEQIRIPPELPEILKNYAKFIIKNHPADIFQASLEYFQSLATQGKAKEGKLSDAQLSRFYRKVCCLFAVFACERILLPQLPKVHD